MVDFISFRPHVGRTIHLCELQANLIQARVQNRPNCGGPGRIREQNPRTVPSQYEPGFDLPKTASGKSLKSHVRYQSAGINRYFSISGYHSPIVTGWHRVDLEGRP